MPDRSRRLATCGGHVPRRLPNHVMWCRRPGRPRRQFLRRPRLRHEKHTAAIDARPQVVEPIAGLRQIGVGLDHELELVRRRGGERTQHVVSSPGRFVPRRPVARRVGRRCRGGELRADRNEVEERSVGGGQHGARGLDGHMVAAVAEFAAEVGGLGEKQRLATGHHDMPRVERIDRREHLGDGHLPALGLPRCERRVAPHAAEVTATRADERGGRAGQQPFSLQRCIDLRDLHRSPCASAIAPTRIAGRQRQPRQSPPRGSSTSRTRRRGGRSGAGRSSSWSGRSRGRAKVRGG